MSLAASPPEVQQKRGEHSHIADNTERGAQRLPEQLRGKGRVVGGCRRCGVDGASNPLVAATGNRSSHVDGGVAASLACVLGSSRGASKSPGHCGPLPAGHGTDAGGTWSITLAIARRTLQSRYGYAIPLQPYALACW
jgi:hypothetical protein